MASRKDEANDKAVRDKFVADTIAEFRRYKTLQKVQVGTLVLCYGALACALAAKFLGGGSVSVISLSLFAAACGLAGVMLGRRLERSVATAKRVLWVIDDMASRETRGGDAGPIGHKIPLTIGFANLAGDDMQAIVSEDAAALGGLFARCTVAAGREIPKANVLFVYARLDDDGTLQGRPGAGIRELVQTADAAIVVLASPNSEASVQKAVALPGRKAANIVFTLDRNGAGFAQFFRDLFGRMGEGAEMLGAWVALAPQGPAGGDASAPRTILVAEGGKIAFPR